MYAACPTGINVLDKKIYVAGGKDKNGNILASVEYYDSATNIWCPVGDLSCV
jgi:hypothetical protein